MSSRPPPARDLSATVLDVPPPPGWRRLPGGVYGRRHDDLAVMVTLDHDGAEPRVWASASRRGRYPSDLEVRAALAALDDADTLARMAKDAAAHSPSCRMGSTGDMCDTCDRLVNDLAVWHWSREGQS